MRIVALPILVVLVAVLLRTYGPVEGLEPLPSTARENASLPSAPNDDPAPAPRSCFHTPLHDLVNRYVPPPARPIQPAHRGSVLSAAGADPDGKDESSVDEACVISLGAEAGVKVGFRYLVSRGTQYITTIQIESVQARRSTGRPVRGLSKDEIGRGDTVTDDPQGSIWAPTVSR